MNKKTPVKRDESTPPVLELSAEDTKAMQEAAQPVVAAMPAFARQFVKNVSAFDKHFEETEERIKRVGRRTSGRIQR